MQTWGEKGARRVRHQIFLISHRSSLERKGSSDLGTELSSHSGKTVTVLYTSCYLGCLPRKTASLAFHWPRLREVSAAGDIHCEVTGHCQHSKHSVTPSTC